MIRLARLPAGDQKLADIARGSAGRGSARCGPLHAHPPHRPRTRTPPPPLPLGTLSNFYLFVCLFVCVCPLFTSLQTCLSAVSVNQNSSFLKNCKFYIVST